MWVNWMRVLGGQLIVSLWVRILVHIDGVVAHLRLQVLTQMLLVLIALDLLALRLFDWLLVLVLLEAAAGVAMKLG